MPLDRASQTPAKTHVASIAVSKVAGATKLHQDHDHCVRRQCGNDQRSGLT